MNHGITWPYQIHVTRPSDEPGVQDPETGVITAPDPIIIADNEWGDWQDDVQSRNIAQGGNAVLDHQARWYFKNESLVYGVKPQDAFVVTTPYELGWSKQGEVAGVEEHSGMLKMRVR